MGAAILGADVYTAPSAPPPFSPLDISGLALWLKADGVLWQDSARTTPAVADGDPVGAWDDTSGNARHVTQALAGKRPTLKLAIQNGKPVVRFDGVDDFLGRAVVAIGTSQIFSLFLALRSTNAVGPVEAFSDGDNAASNGIRYAIDTSKRVVVYGGVLGFPDDASTSSWELVEIVRSVAGGTDLYVNTLPTSIVGNTTVPNAPTVGLRVGCLLNGTEQRFWPGDFAEILLYDNGIGVSQRQQLEGYINSRWGIY